MKQFNLTDLASFNLKLIVATFVLHWLSFYDESLFNPMFIRSTMLELGFHTTPYISFELAAIFFFMIFLVYTPVALFDLLIIKLPTRFTRNISVSPSDMKFKKGKHIENLIRFITFALMCLTPYLFIESFISGVAVLPFTFFHMILMAITTFMHGLQMLAIYRILLPRFVKLTKAFRSNLILAIW